MSTLQPAQHSRVLFSIGPISAEPKSTAWLCNQMLAVHRNSRNLQMLRKTNCKPNVHSLQLPKPALNHSRCSSGTLLLTQAALMLATHPQIYRQNVLKHVQTLESTLIQSLQGRNSRMDGYKKRIKRKGASAKGLKTIAFDALHHIYWVKYLLLLLNQNQPDYVVTGPEGSNCISTEYSKCIRRDVNSNQLAECTNVVAGEEHSVNVREITNCIPGNLNSPVIHGQEGNSINHGQEGNSINHGQEGNSIHHGQEGNSINLTDSQESINQDGDSINIVDLHTDSQDSLIQQHLKIHEHVDKQVSTNLEFKPLHDEHKFKETRHHFDKSDKLLLQRVCDTTNINYLLDFSTLPPNSPKLQLRETHLNNKYITKHNDIQNSAILHLLGMQMGACDIEWNTHVEFVRLEMAALVAMILEVMKMEANASSELRYKLLARLYVKVWWLTDCAELDT